MSTTAVRSPAEFEGQLQRYLYERSEEGRAVRVGEKEVSEQAAIVARYSDLFSRDQLRALRDEEARAEGDEREWLYRLRKTCEGGLLAAELAEKDDELENEILAARLTFNGEELPLRSAGAAPPAGDGGEEIGEVRDLGLSDDVFAGADQPDGPQTAMSEAMASAKAERDAAAQAEAPAADAESAAAETAEGDAAETAEGDAAETADAGDAATADADPAEPAAEAGDAEPAADAADPAETNGSEAGDAAPEPDPADEPAT